MSILPDGFVESVGINTLSHMFLKDLLFGEHFAPLAKYSVPPAPISTVVDCPLRPIPIDASASSDSFNLHGCVAQLTQYPHLALLLSLHSMLNPGRCIPHFYEFEDILD